MFPKDFISPYNMKKLRKKIRHFISLNRFETIVNKSIMAGFSIEKVKWLN